MDSYTPMSPGLNVSDLDVNMNDHIENSFRASYRNVDNRISKRIDHLHDISLRSLSLREQTTNGTNDVVNLTTELHGKLTDAMDYSASMFETNITCLSKIMQSQIENAKIVETNANLKDKNDVLVEVIEKQQQKIRNLELLLEIKQVWLKMFRVVSPNFTDFKDTNEELLSNVLTVIAHNVACETLQSRSVNSSILLQMLHKVNDIERHISVDLVKVNEENFDLRERLQTKSEEIEVMKSQVEVALRLEEQLHEEMKEVSSENSQLQAKVKRQDGDLSRLQNYLDELGQENAELKQARMNEEKVKLESTKSKKTTRIKAKKREPSSPHPHGEFLKSPMASMISMSKTRKCSKAFHQTKPISTPSIPSNVKREVDDSLHFYSNLSDASKKRLEHKLQLHKLSMSENIQEKRNEIEAFVRDFIPWNK